MGEQFACVKRRPGGDRLKWEPFRGGALFPHLYGDFDVTAVRRVESLTLWPEGRHVFPALDD